MNTKKEYYPQPVRGTYYFETCNFDGTFNHWCTPVDVLGGTDKSYYIRLIYPVRKNNAGDVIRVLKKKVVLADLVQNTAPEPKLDTSDYWFNNFESRELDIQ